MKIAQEISKQREPGSHGFWLVLKSKYPEDVFGPAEYIVQKITTRKPKRIHCVKAMDFNSSGPKQTIIISESHIPEDMYSPNSPVVFEAKRKIREQLVKLRNNGERLYLVEQYKDLLDPERQIIRDWSNGKTFRSGRKNCGSNP